MTTFDVGINHASALCGCPVSCGSGYDVLTAPIGEVTSWTAITEKGLALARCCPCLSLCCCCCSCYTIAQVGFSAGRSAFARLDTGMNTTMFTEPLRVLMSAARGLTQLSVSPTLKSFTYSKCWTPCNPCAPCTVDALNIRSNGDVAYSRRFAFCCDKFDYETGGFLQVRSGCDGVMMGYSVIRIA